MTDARTVILGYVSSLFITFVIEIPVLYFLFRRTGIEQKVKIIKAGIYAQLLTHPTSFIIIPSLVYYIAGLFNLSEPLWIRPSRSIVYYEMVIPVAEGIFYCCYLKPAKKYYAFVISFVVNALSWGLGSLIPDHRLINYLIQ